MMLIWLTGGLMLLAGGLITYLLKPHKADMNPFRVRLHRNRRVLRLLRHVLRACDDQPYTRPLKSAAPFLQDRLRQMNRRIASLPALPSAPDGEPRVMETARDAADLPELEGHLLVDMLKEASLDTSEILAFPVCIAYAESQRLSAVLSLILSDLNQARQAAKFVRKMQRSKRPDQLLRRCSLNSYGLYTLLRALQAQHADSMIALVEKWLQELELQASDLISSSAQREQRYAQEIRRTQDCFSTLQRMNWLDICSAADETHSLLMGDPGGTYPRMDPVTQLQLRVDIDKLSRKTAFPAADLIRRAFILCGTAAESSLESCISYYFQDTQGLLSLHRSLPTRRGRLYVRLSRRCEQLRYAVYWAVAAIIGLGLLQSGQPVFILPFFLMLTGSILRHSLGKLPRHMPGMLLSPGDQELRTLIVLHAMLADQQDVSRAVQRLKAAIRSLHGEKADFLLIGDFGPCITAVSGFDQPLMQAVSQAITALADRHVMYLHRGRAWDDAAHCYRARAGQRSAITEVCRLVAAGECQDSLVYATVIPASLERRYAYVLTLGHDVTPAPGMLERFLSVMAHPLCQPHPAAKGIRGHAMLLPEGISSFNGTAFIRPDAFLEAVDGRLHDRFPANDLCGELAGQASVDGAAVFCPPPAAGWDDQYSPTLSAWQVFPWQLPIVSTPAGWIDNPLSFFQRFHLRELLRQTLVPLSQAVTLLWGLLTVNWPMMLLALLLPEYGTHLRSWNDFLAVLSRISLLPTRVAVNVAAVVQLLRKKGEQPPDWPSLEAWTQGLSATIMAALVFLLPSGGVAAFILTVLFACFPLAHRFGGM